MNSKEIPLTPWKGGVRGFNPLFKRAGGFPKIKK